MVVFVRSPLGIVVSGLVSIAVAAFIYFVKESTENLWGRFFAKEQSDYFTRLWASEANRRRVLEAFDRLAALRGAQLLAS